jgi:uncharacterized membrane protein YkoI
MPETATPKLIPSWRAVLLMPPTTGLGVALLPERPAAVRRHSQDGYAAGAAGNHHDMQAKQQVLALGVSGVIVLAATACQSSGESKPTSAPSSPGSSNGSSDPMSTSAKKTARLMHAKRAVTLAGEDISHARPYDLESAHYRHKRAWDIKVASGQKPEYELYLNEKGTKVLHKHQKSKRDDDAAKAMKSKTSLASAMKKADKHDKGILREAEIDRHRGNLLWSVKFAESTGNDHAVTVSATTGKFLGTTVEED